MGSSLDDVLVKLLQVRIRMVEQPDSAPNVQEAFRRYSAAGGITALYDGLLPLLVRQVHGMHTARPLPDSIWQMFKLDDLTR